MELTNDPQNAGTVEIAPTAALPAGQVFVAAADGSAAIAAGKKAVLEASGAAPVELKTGTYNGTVAAGAYVRSESIGGLYTRAATIRRHRWQDNLGKIASWAGLLVWLPGLIGLILAGLSLVFVNASAPTSRADVAAAAKDIAQWVANPPSTAPASSADRLAAARACLDALGGGAKAEGVTIPGVKCTPKEPSFFQDKDNAALIAVIGGLATAGLSLVSSAQKFRFGQSP